MHHITTQELLDLLSIVQDQHWSVPYLGGGIRNEVGDCPICAIVNEIQGTHNFSLGAHSALESLDVIDDGRVVGNFMYAADYDYSTVLHFEDIGGLVELRKRIIDILQPTNRQLLDISHLTKS